MQFGIPKKIIVPALLLLAVALAVLVIGEDDYATAYLEQIEASKSDTYARAYAEHIDAGISPIFAIGHARVSEHIEQIVAEGKTSEYAYAFAGKSLAGKSEEYARAYAEQVDAGKSEEYARVYAGQVDARKSAAYVDVFFEKINAGESLAYAAAYHDKIEKGQSTAYAHSYADRIGAGKSEDYAHTYAGRIDAGKSENYAHAYAAQIDNGKSVTYARKYADSQDSGEDGIADNQSQQAMNAIIVLAMYSTTDDTAADKRAVAVWEMAAHVERGALNNDRALELLNAFAPEASIDARAKALERLSSISDSSNGDLTPEQSMQVANEMTRLITGHGIDAEKRTEAAQELVRLSQSGELNGDNASELIDTIAPEWSIAERREALGYLAWQFSQGDWDADSSKRTAEEGYTLLTGGEIQLERRMEAGVGLVGDGLRRYGGDTYDDESVDQATDLIRETISGNPNTASVSDILNISDSQTSSRRGSDQVDPEVLREQYDRVYSNVLERLPRFGYPAGYRGRQYPEGESADSYARAYARAIVYDGRSSRYARAYAALYESSRETAASSADAYEQAYRRAYFAQIDSGQSSIYAHAYAEQTVGEHVGAFRAREGRNSSAYAHAYAEQIEASNGATYANLYSLSYEMQLRHASVFWKAHAYAEQVVAGRSLTYASAYAEQIGVGKSEDLSHTYAGQIDAGKSDTYARTYVEQIEAGRTDSYSRSYAEQLTAGKSDSHARVYAEAIEAGKRDGFALDYAQQVAAGKSKEYARTYAELTDAGKSPGYAREYAERVEAGFSGIYAHSIASQIEAGKGLTYAETYYTQIAAGRPFLYAHMYAWVVNLMN